MMSSALTSSKIIQEDRLYSGHNDTTVDFLVFLNPTISVTGGHGGLLAQYECELASLLVNVEIFTAITEFQ